VTRERPQPAPPAGAPVAPETPAARAVPECHDEVCITCSDQAVAVTVVRLLDDGLALVDTGAGHEDGAGREEVSVALVAAAVGDTILVHAGEAIAVLGGDLGG
jgi:hydrogenase expression/formation protein HypC